MLDFGFRAKPYAKMPLTTLPATSVSRKSRPGIAVGKAFVVQAQQMQHCGVQVMDMHRVFSRSEAKFIRRAVNSPAFYAASGEPDAEPIMIMVAAT